MYLDLEVTGDDRAERHFFALRCRFNNPRPVLENEVTTYLRGAERRLFKSQGRGRWPALAASTVRRKGHDRPLYDTGALEQSLTSRTGDSVDHVDGDTLTFGTSLFYGAFLVRRRPFLANTPATGRAIARRVTKWLLEPFE